jgi:hypothetical protein
MPQDNDDPLSRRDVGLEFLDVTARAPALLVDSDRKGRRQRDVYQITNNSTSMVDTHLLVIARGLSGSATLENASGVTSDGDPYLRLYLPDGVLTPGQSIVTTLVFRETSGRQGPPLTYSLRLLSGQGKP